MSVTVTLNKANVLRRIRNGTDNARIMVTENVKKYSDPYTPEDKGNLIGDAKVNPQEGTITYDKPYAKKLWYGVDINFSQDKKEDGYATFKWCDKGVQANKKALDTVAQNAFTKGMK